AVAVATEEEHLPADRPAACDEAQRIHRPPGAPLAGLAPGSALRGSSASSPACIHPGALAKRAAQCPLVGLLHFWARAGRPTSLPTASPQESQLPRTPSTAPVQAQCSSQLFATSSDGCDLLIDSSIDTTATVTTRFARISATTHTAVGRAIAPH